MKTFKSSRAAKMNYTKAENAYMKALDERNAAQHNYWTRDYSDAAKSHLEACQEAVKSTFTHAHAVYKAAEEQGFFISSWYFGSNPTRDLIHANMD